MAVLLVVPFPSLGRTVGERLDVRSGIERIAVGLVESELDDLGSYGNTVGIVSLDLYGMLSCITETKLDTVSGICVVLAGDLAARSIVDRIGRSDNPYRDDPLVVHVEGDVVCRLVDIHGHVEAGGLRQLAFLEFRIIRRTSGQGCY